MASAWGKSWGSAWGNSWGSIAATATGGSVGGGKSKVYTPKRLIRADDIEFENIEQLTEYLAEKLEEAETKPIEVVRKKKAKQHPYAAAPVVKLQYTGPGYLEIASIYVKRANDEIRRIWAERILVMLQEQEDEETLMLLLT